MATTLNVPGTYPTISAAVTAAASGDTILVAAGYAGNEAVGVTVDNLIFSAPSDVLGIVLTAGTGVQQITLAGTSPIRIIGNTADNTLQGNAGANDISDGGGGNDTMSGGDGDDLIVSSGGTDTLNGGNGNDTLTAGDGDDLLSGGAGDDTLVGGGGANQLFGGDGNDTASYASTTGPVYAILGGSPEGGGVGVWIANVPGVLVDELDSIENLTGGPAADNLNGDSGDNVLTGGAGTDYLEGFGGNDTLIGGAAGSGGANRLFGDDGNDTASYAGTTGAVYADLQEVYGVVTQVGYVDGVLVDQMSGIENLIGGLGSNTLVGVAGSNVLVGHADTDYLYGQGGDDTLISGAAGSAGANQLWGGTGIDTASYAGTTGAVYADLGALAGYVDGVLVDQMNSIENLIGGSGSNTLIGDAGTNRLKGHAGTDYLYGQGGDDLLIAGAAGSAGANQLWGGTGNDTALYGGTTGAIHADLGTQTGYVDGVLVDQMNSIENLGGGSNADTLVGNSGANRLEGSSGGDALWGKGGADVFVYFSYSDSNLVAGYDTIADFASGTSKLDLRLLRTDAAHVLIQSDAQSTSLYVEKTPGVFNASTDLAISLVGANAITVNDILF